MKAGAQSTEPHQPGLDVFLVKILINAMDEDIDNELIKLQMTESWEKELIC